MKKIAVLVLALVANAIADDEKMLQNVAQNFETDEETVKVCLTGAETTIEELNIAKEKWLELKEDEDVDEETKESFVTHGRFIACMLEKKDLLKDSKLVVPKIVEKFEKEREPGMANKEALTECLNSLNEDDEMTREDRALGLIFCFHNPNKR